MRRLGYMIALLGLLLCAAETALPGLVRESLMVPVTLADGSHVKLEAMVVRPLPGPFVPSTDMTLIDDVLSG